MKTLENIFIQSFMDEDANTFLEVGEKDTNTFTSVPTEFDVVSNGTCFIRVSKSNFNKINNKWNVNQNEVQKALQNQWRKSGTDSLIIFSIK